MHSCVYTKKNYRVYKVGRGFIIHNINENFEDFHTHVNNYNLCKIIIHVALHGEFPSRSKRLEKNKRVMDSILRICDNESIKQKIREISDI